MNHLVPTFMEPSWKDSTEIRVFGLPSFAQSSYHLPSSHIRNGEQRNRRENVIGCWRLEVKKAPQDPSLPQPQDKEVL